MALSPDSPLPDLPTLIETEQLEECLNHPKLRIVDATWYGKLTKRDANREYISAHIPGAVRFNIDDIADKASPFPHMIPSSEFFSQKVSQLGIDNDSHVIAYDSEGMASAACRVWWMFRLFGHDKVSVLNGGIHKWKAEQRPTSNKPVRPAPAKFTASYRPELFRDVDQMLKNIETGTDQVIDTRSLLRFQGKVPEPWASHKTGHIPGSLHMLFSDLIDPETRCLLPEDQQREKFKEINFDFERPTSVYCGSGITACVTALSLFLLGYPEAAVYVGSWAEWGVHPDTPVEKD